MQNLPVLLKVLKHFSKDWSAWAEAFLCEAARPNAAFSFRMVSMVAISPA